METETRTFLERIIVGMDAGFASLQTEMRDRFASLQTETRDGFESVDARLLSIERDVSAVWTETKAHGVAIAGLSERIASLTERVGGLEKRIDSMNDDMRQRFRTVIERLAALERSAR